MLYNHDHSLNHKHSSVILVLMGVPNTRKPTDLNWRKLAQTNEKWS